MKKFMVAIVVVVMVGFGFAAAYAADSVTPIRLALVPTVAIPSQQIVHGLDLALGDNINEVQGVQLSLIYSGTKSELVGVQAGLIDIGNEVTGLEWGFYNQADNMKGVQVGFINWAEHMNGIQIGLVNIIKSGGLFPVMVIFNASL